MITAEAALLEKVAREKARRKLMAYATYIAPWYKPARHHELVADYLELVELYIRSDGENGIGRLIISEPPRHGKTEEVSRLFPSWLLGRQPDKRVILTSYGADLAQDDSKAVRRYVTSERYRAVFGDLSAVDTPVMLSDESRSMAGWELAEPHRGGVVAAGIGGGITGKGAHLLVVDDPFKNREEAESEAYRKRVMTWYQSSAYTRLEKGGAVVITHTRWHPDDLVGQLLQAMASDPLADQWTVLYLPAIALEEKEYPKSDEELKEMMLRGKWLPREDALGRKAGEALWEEKFSKDALERIRVNIGDYDFDALYQQLPDSESGGFFSEGDFVIVDEAPKGLQWYRYCDLALGRTARSDRNSSGATALDKDGNLYVRDMLHVRELDEFLAQVKSWMVSDLERGTIWGIEDVAMQAVVMREFMRDPKLAAVAVRPVTPNGSKMDRARPVQTRGRQGKVYLVRGTWNRDFINQAIQFPHGAHDDMVDSVSGGVQMIAEMAGKKGIARSFQG